MGTITLRDEEQRKLEILGRLEAGALSVEVAASLLGVSARQVRRQRVRYRQRGAASVVHGNRGRQAANRVAAEVQVRIVSLAGAGGKYHDLNVSHLQELLAQEEQIVIGRSTLDRLLKAAGLRSKRRATPPPHRRKRLRRPAEGMLVQIDGSSFAWLEERGAKATLLGAIDDATSKVLGLHFRPSEDQAGYLLLLRSLVQTHGLPLSIYHDRHTILRSPKQPTLEEELRGQTPMSQVQRLLAELGVESIPAYSPQAKGRIERLWGSLQERLTKELRLHGITTLEAANAFLPDFLVRYNARFARAPADPNSAWVPGTALDYDYHFAAREKRKVRADHCISYANQELQLLLDKRHASLAHKTVTVHVVPEGNLYVYHGHCRIPYRQLPPKLQAATESSAPQVVPGEGGADEGGADEGGADEGGADEANATTGGGTAPPVQAPQGTKRTTASQRAWLYNRHWPT
jgi:transposase